MKRRRIKLTARKRLLTCMFLHKALDTTPNGAKRGANVKFLATFVLLLAGLVPAHADSFTSATFSPTGGHVTGGGFVYDNTLNQFITFEIDLDVPEGGISLNHGFWINLPWSIVQLFSFSAPVNCLGSTDEQTTFLVFTGCGGGLNDFSASRTIVAPAPDGDTLYSVAGHGLDIEQLVLQGVDGPRGNVISGTFDVILPEPATLNLSLWGMLGLCLLVGLKRLPPRPSGQPGILRLSALIRMPRR